MHELKISEAAAVLGVSPDTVRRLAAAGTIKARRTQGGQRMIAGPSLAAYLVKQSRRAARGASSQQSIRNRLPGIITRVEKDKVAAQVEIQVGPHRVVSLLTREAVEALRLEPGMPAIATIKATNVSVELATTASRARRKT